MYYSRLEKACLLLGFDTEWGTKAVTAVIHRVARADDTSFCPKVAISEEELTQIVTTGSDLEISSRS